MNKNKTDKIVVDLTKWLGITLFVGIIIWAAVYFFEGYRYEQTNDAQIDAYLSPINAKVGGYIRKIYYKDNQQVKKGDTLVVIEQDEYGLKRDAASAELMSAQAKLPILAASEETQVKSIAVIKAQLEGAKARLNQQQKEFDRYKNLLADESTTQQKFDNISATLFITQSDYDQTKASLQVAESKLNDFRVQHNAIKAEIKIKEALLKRQELDIRYAVITAPFDGQIGKKTIQAGQLIQPGQTLAFLVNRAEEKWVMANFKETQIGKFKIGQAVSIEVDAFPNEKFNGSIESLSPTTGSRYSLLPPDNATGNFVKIIQRIPVRIKLTDIPEKLTKLSAGMNANVYVLKN
ncbi:MULTISPECIES: HlyD family secretion protein [Sphingobacterium]|jgi:membrane fusion protein (multidrug efflux system)|uniref:Inner membrane protein yibH n=1 Tax=Sphingobacterium multivorum TaxID=28454 RepID=A0A654DEV2_SPHMU|nr:MULTISPECIES: HlyD family secretion protein [Sphingobacterium]QQT45346.1 HlyD family secretion protein [Sphingobacterium multivorum]QQT62015.1 HlyD family secretion protein [Sphingobacterium multivorum]SUJ23851.1 Inner membrane protein yibH [Sphingobacterium multivorum]VXD03851.1 Inner membrane protein yibH [Sphingobacterium multivorum]